MSIYQLEKKTNTKLLLGESLGTAAKATGPKPNISMIAGFSDPWNPVCMDLINIPKALQIIQGNYEHNFGNMFVNMGIIFLNCFFATNTSKCMIITGDITLVTKNY